MGVGGLEKSRLKLASAKVEVEAELGNNQFGFVWFTLSITTYLKLRVSLAKTNSSYTPNGNFYCAQTLQF